MVPNSHTADPANSTSKQSTLLGSIVHLLALFSWVIGPAIVYIVSNSEFTRDNARNALNWQILFTTIPVLLFALSLILNDIFVIVGALFVVFGGFLTIAFCLVATFKAIRGNTWEYPFAPAII